MKLLITISLIALILAATSCESSKKPDDISNADAAFEEAIENAIRAVGGYAPDTTQLEIEQKFRRFMYEGEANLGVYKRLEDIERDMLRYETASENMTIVLDYQDHYLQLAMDCFSQSLLIHPNSYAAHQGVALAAVRMGKNDLAIKHGLIVLQGSESRKLIYRVLLLAYQRKSLLAKTRTETILYLRKAEALVTKYGPNEPEPDIHLMTYILAEIHAKIATNLSGPAREIEFQKAASILEAHLEKYPKLLDSPDREMATFAHKMKAASNRYKNAK